MCITYLLSNHDPASCAEFMEHMSAGKFNDILLVAALPIIPLQRGGRPEVQTTQGTYIVRKEALWVVVPFFGVPQSLLDAVGAHLGTVPIKDTEVQAIKQHQTAEGGNHLRQA